MRTLIFVLLSLTLSSQASFVSNLDVYFAPTDSVEQTKQKIQDRIMNAFMNSFAVQNNSELLSLIHI